MTFNWDISVGDIIALIALFGSVLMFFLSKGEKNKTEEFAKNADGFNNSAKKYYDFMLDKSISEWEGNMQGIEESKAKKANCDANIIKLGNNKWILKIFNKGNYRATNVSFKYIDDNAPPIHGDPFPIKILDEHKNVDYNLLIHLGLDRRSWEYEITWTNEDLTEGKRNGVLTLPLS